MRYTTKVKKAGYAEYFVTVVDTENVKPTVTVKLERFEGDREYQWQIGLPVKNAFPPYALDYDFNDCCGHPTKKSAIWWTQRDGIHIDENTVTDNNN